MYDPVEARDFLIEGAKDTTLPKSRTTTNITKGKT